MPIYAFILSIASLLCLAAFFAITHGRDAALLWIGFGLGILGLALGIPNRSKRFGRWALGIAMLNLFFYITFLGYAVFFTLFASPIAE